MKRILHLIPTLEPGGAQKQLMLLAQGLERDAFRIQVCALRASAGPALEMPADVETHTLSARRGGDLAGWQRLAELVRRLAPDILHAWTPEAYRWAWLATRLVTKSRLVVTLRDDGSTAPWRWRVADRRLWRGASRVIVDCEAVRQRVAADSPLAGRIVVIPSGVERPTAGRTRAELLQMLDLSSDTLLVGAAGPLRADRRWKDLIWAADMLKFIRHDVHLLVAGDGPQRWRLERFTRQVRIEDKVHFLGARRDWPQWLSCLDVFWSGRESAGQPLALLEAMAHGLPVVATSAPGSAELIEDRQDGCLVPVGNRAAIARATQKLFDNPQLRKQWGEAARRKVLEQFSVSAMLARVAEVYEDVCGGEMNRE